jgi:hypothetical protein
VNDPAYNRTYFRDGILTYRKDGKEHESISVFTTSDGTLIGIFQGTKGDNPDLDFIVKFLAPGRKQRLRTPKNVHWVVDLLIRGNSDRDQAAALVDALIQCYEKAEPFATIEERAGYAPEEARRIAEKFAHLKDDGLLPVEFVSMVIELFSICEKASPREKKMFRELLGTVKGYFEGTKDYYQVLNASAPGFR